MNQRVFHLEDLCSLFAISIRTSSSSSPRPALVPTHGSCKRWWLDKWEKVATIARSGQSCVWCLLMVTSMVIVGSPWFLGARAGVHQRHHWEPQPLVDWVDWLEPCPRHERRWRWSWRTTCEDNRDDTQVRTGRIILWTPQLLSIEILTSSTNSRCTTPLHTLGGDIVWKTMGKHFYFTFFFTASSFLRTPTELDWRRMDTMLTGFRWHERSYQRLCWKNVFLKMVGFERPDGKMTVVVTNRHTVTPINVVGIPQPTWFC